MGWQLYNHDYTVTWSYTTELLYKDNCLLTNQGLKNIIETQRNGRKNTRTFLAIKMQRNMS